MSRIDVDTVNRNVDLLALVGQDVKLERVASTKGGEYAGPCPKCGGTDRFRVQPEMHRWMCRKCSSRWSDPIAYVMWYAEVDFRTACDRLGHYEPPPDTGRPVPRAAAKPDDGIDRDRWQAAALALVAAAEAALWAPGGEQALRYLRQSRGLTDSTIRNFKLGLVPETRFDELATWGIPPEVNPDTGKPGRVWLPHGIVIPCIVDGRIQYIKIRRSPKDVQPGDKKKIPFVKGSHPYLFNADAAAEADVVMLVEGEFDAMLAHQAAGGRLAAATLGSAQAWLDLERYGRFLVSARRILLAYDVDDTGKEEAAKKARMSARIERVRVPVLRSGDKDITDYHRAGGDLSGWIGYILGQDKAPDPEPVPAAIVTAEAPAPAGGLPVEVFMAGKSEVELRDILEVGRMLGRSSAPFYQAAVGELARRAAPETGRPLWERKGGTLL